MNPNMDILNSRKHFRFVFLPQKTDLTKRLDTFLCSFVLRAITDHLLLSVPPTPIF